MKKLAVIFPVFLALTAFTFSTQATWKTDKPHAELGFTITHLGVSDVSGTFNDFEASITSSKPDFSDAVCEMTAKVASIDTRVEMRDNHLKSADFFDAEKFPEITFKSTGIKKAAAKDHYTVSGNLTMHGVTKAIALDMHYRGTTENPMSKKATAGFRLTGTIKRSDFGIGASFPAPMLSDEVQISANGEFVQ